MMNQTQTTPEIKFEQIHRDRLTKLMEHLRTGELGHEEFDFGQFNSEDGPKCGTAGCAIGECPIVWPNDWIFSESGTPMLKNLNANMFVSLSSGEDWFGLIEDEYDHMFEPTCQNPDEYGGEYLNRGATRYDVADNIEAFLAYKERDSN